MDRDGTGRSGQSPDSGVAQVKSRFTSPLVINSASQRRRSLFSRPRTKEPSASTALSGTRATEPPNDTKIPRPAPRRPFTLSDAYRMAEEEEVAQGSPSPAPRLWSRRESSEKRAPRVWSAASSDSQHREGLDRKSLESGRDDGADGHGVRSLQGDLSDSSFDEKLRQYALNKASSEEPARRSSGLFTRTKLGNMIETGKDLVRKTSRGSLDGSSSPRAMKTTPSSTWLSRRLPGRKLELSDATSARKAGDVPRDGPSPDESFAWQADADFTATDLQVSNSPPVAIGRTNTKIEEIRALEAEVDERFSENTEHRLPSARIDEIRPLEAEGILKFSDQPRQSNGTISGSRATEPEGEVRTARSRSMSRTDMRTDESRSREIERLSRKVLATAGLDELRGKNMQTASRSPSPDVTRRSSNKEPRRAFSPLGDRLRRQEGEEQAAAEQAEKISAGGSSLGPAFHAQTDQAGTSNTQGTSQNQQPQRDASQPSGEPREFSHRLAAATRPGPASEQQGVPDSDSPRARDIPSAGDDSARQKFGSGVKIDARPTVGFADLPRTSSTVSGLSKRGSFVHSDSDPTERIEGEMKLFAPLENQSERGSLRAPSPVPESDAAEETPRPVKPDPLTQPTPRVTGAYVETPATVKVDKLDDADSNAAVDVKGVVPRTNGLGPSSTDSSVDSNPSVSQDGRDRLAPRPRKRTQSHSTGSDRSLARSSSLSARRRARSLPRSRAPLINSAKPPTVKDDLLEIQRANQIEDSTLDDIADLLVHKAHPVNDGDDKPDIEKELEAYDRMSRSLKTGLLGIRTAKQGIERLEGQFSHGDVKESPQKAQGDRDEGAPTSCPACHGGQPTAHATTTYVHLPLPRLWHRRPRFRFTFLGLALFLLSLWYIAESWMCFLYCKPEYCYPGTPCDWSPEDPIWGYAIPVKLDEWAAGGRGRSLARRLGPEVADWIADLWDAATGTDISTVDTSRYSWEQKRQHRRRLAKKGLSHQPFAERHEDGAIFNVWNAVRRAREKAQAARDKGYDIEEDESIATDERL